MEEEATAPAQPTTTRSEALGELAIALAKAQGQIQGAVKDAVNPHFRSRYADLASVWDACRGPLSANGLSVVQMPERDGNEVAVTTLLLHSSGQWISSRLSTVPGKIDPQGIGSAITYLRRYALAATVGIAPEDDDDNGASASQGNGSGPPRADGPEWQPAPPSDGGKKKETPKVDKVADALKKIAGCRTVEEFDKLGASFTAVAFSKSERSVVAEAFKKGRAAAATGKAAADQKPPGAELATCEACGAIAGKRHAYGCPCDDTGGPPPEDRQPGEDDQA